MGQGAYGEVFRGIYVGALVAVMLSWAELMGEQPGNVQQLANEIRILRRCGTQTSWFLWTAGGRPLQASQQDRTSVSASVLATTLTGEMFEAFGECNSSYSAGVTANRNLGMMEH